MKKLFFTCEHGGNQIPLEFKKLFTPYKTLLNSHRGYDIGILDVFKKFTNEFDAESFYSDNSRLLIELNRSPHHKNLFSEITKPLNKDIKQYIVDKYYKPFRTEVESKIEKFIKKKINVFHISFHSFTPELNGKVRNADIGLLYDPKSEQEKEFCIKWKKEIAKINSELMVRFNYPYLGIADGFTSFLRKKFGYKFYGGIELEINQKLLNNKSALNQTTRLLINSFMKVEI